MYGASSSSLPPLPEGSPPSLQETPLPGLPSLSGRGPWPILPSLSRSGPPVPPVIPAGPPPVIPAGPPPVIPAGPPLSFPPVPPCHSRRSPSVIPAGPPLSFPPVPPCHSRRSPPVIPAGFPLSFPPVPLCHSRRLLAGIQCLSLLSLLRVVLAWEKAMDSRLKTSGMTEGGLKMSGMTGRLKMSGMTGRNRVPPQGKSPGFCKPFVMPALSPSVRPAGPPCHSRRSPLSFPPVPPCHSRRLLAGIQGLALLSLLRVVLHGKSRGFPIKNVGNDRRGINNVRNDRAIENVGNDRAESCAPAGEKPWILQAFCHACSVPLCQARRSPLSCPPVPHCHSRRFPPTVIPAGPPLSFPPVVSGNPGSCSSVPSSGGPCMGKSRGFPIKNVGNDRRGIKDVGNDRAIENVGNDRAESCAPAGEKPWILQAFCHACSVPLCQARRSPLSCPPVPPCHSRRSPSVIPAGFPLSFPPVPPCHSRRLLAGIQGLALLSLLRVVLHGKSRGFPIKNVGNDRRGINNVRNDRAIENVGNDRAESCAPAGEKPWILQAFCHACSVPLCQARRSPSVSPAGPPLSGPPVSPITNVGDKVSGNPGSCSSVPSSGGPAWGKAVDSRLKTSGMTEGGLKTSGMTEGD